MDGFKGQLMIGWIAVNLDVTKLKNIFRYCGC